MKRLSLSAVLVAVFSFLISGMAMAQYSSVNYKSNEIQFGAGGDNNQRSTNYSAGVSAGSLGVGNYAGTNYKTYSGFLTPNEPFIELGIDSSTADLGVLDVSTTKTSHADFHVRAYIDTGYTVQTLSQPPSYTSGASSHTLTPMSTLATPSPGTEQFGINLVANTAPVAFGNDPSPQPDNTFATGVAATGYNTPNQFKYHVGDVVANTPSGSSGWGLTNYTISYIANQSILTPAGNYTMIQDLVVVANY